MSEFVAVPMWLVILGAVTCISVVSFVGYLYHKLNQPGE